MNTGRSLKAIQSKLIKKEVLKNKSIISDRIVVFKSSSTVTKYSLGSLSK